MCGCRRRRPFLITVANFLPGQPLQGCPAFQAVEARGLPKKAASLDSAVSSLAFNLQSFHRLHFKRGSEHSFLSHFPSPTRTARAAPQRSCSQSPKQLVPDCCLQQLEQERLPVAVVRRRVASRLHGRGCDSPRSPLSPPRCTSLPWISQLLPKQDSRPRSAWKALLAVPRHGIG